MRPTPLTLSYLGAFGLFATLLCTSASAGVHPADDIQSLQGLEGFFGWYEPDNGGCSHIAFEEEESATGVEGRYTLSRAIWVSPFEWWPWYGRFEYEACEAGTFSTLGNNPAIGWAILSLHPEGGTPRPYVVQQLIRAEEPEPGSWPPEFVETEIEQLTLQELLPGEGSQLGPMFAVVRDD